MQKLNDQQMKSLDDIRGHMRDIHFLTNSIADAVYLQNGTATMAQALERMSESMTGFSNIIALRENELLDVHRFLTNAKDASE